MGREEKEKRKRKEEKTEEKTEEKRKRTENRERKQRKKSREEKEKEKEKRKIERNYKSCGTMDRSSTRGTTSNHLCTICALSLCPVPVPCAICATSVTTLQ